MIQAQEKPYCGFTILLYDSTLKKLNKKWFLYSLAVLLISDWIGEKNFIYS